VADVKGVAPWEAPKLHWRTCTHFIINNSPLWLSMLAKKNLNINHMRLIKTWKVILKT
jgi:hypothetical protein